jgi:uncharacterized lipoprotein YmbA
MELNMLKKLAMVCMVMALCACSSTHKNTDRAPVVEPIGSQKLSTNFSRQGVKLEWDCSWGTGFSDATCVKGDVKAIEVTAYAPSFGNSEANREAAFSVAHDMALVKLNRFIQDEISSSRVTTTLTKNVEKANDKLKSKIGVAETVRLNDDDPYPDSNVANRENVNEVVRTVTESIRTQSSGILKGVRSIDEKIVDRQTVAVTVRWDKDSAQAVRELQKRIR